MMKNNKGFTVLELIVTFAFVMFLSIGMMSLVNSYRESSQKEAVRKSMNSYKNQIVKAIQDDISLYQIEKIENITENLGDYDRGLKFTFKTKKNDGSAITKNLKLLNKGNSITKAKIEYDGVIYTAPDKFVNLISDTMIYSEPTTIDYEIIDNNGNLNKYEKVLNSINLKIRNEDINENFDIHIVCVGSALSQSIEYLSLNGNTLHANHTSIIINPLIIPDKIKGGSYEKIDFTSFDDYDNSINVDEIKINSSNLKNIEEKSFDKFINLKKVTFNKIATNLNIKKNVFNPSVAGLEVIFPSVENNATVTINTESFPTGSIVKMPDDLLEHLIIIDSYTGNMYKQIQMNSNEYPLCDVESGLRFTINTLKTRCLSS